MALYGLADRLVSVSEALHEVNREKLAEYASPEKFTYARNTINFERIHHLATGIPAGPRPRRRPAGTPVEAVTLSPGPHVAARRRRAADEALRRGQCARRGRAAGVAARGAAAGAGRADLRHRRAALDREEPRADGAGLRPGPRGGPEHPAGHPRQRPAARPADRRRSPSSGWSRPSRSPATSPIRTRSWPTPTASSSPATTRASPWCCWRRMVLGLPVVTTEFGSVRGALPEGYGLVVKLKVDALADGHAGVPARRGPDRARSTTRPTTARPPRSSTGRSAPPDVAGPAMRARRAVLHRSHMAPPCHWPRPAMKGSGVPSTPLLADNRRPPGNSWVLPEHRMVYISVTKAACSSLRWMIADLVGEDFDRFYQAPGNHETRLMTIHAPARPLAARAADHRTRRPKCWSQISRDNGWLIFAVVRDPWSRLWSAWQSKLLTRHASYVRELRPRTVVPARACLRRRRRWTTGARSSRRNRGSRTRACRRTRTSCRRSRRCTRRGSTTPASTTSAELDELDARHPRASQERGPRQASSTCRAPTPAALSLRAECLADGVAETIRESYRRDFEQLR